jgi:hypothetical protein
MQRAAAACPGRHPPSCICYADFGASEWL